MNAVLLNVIPILLLISFGFLVQKKKWLKDSTVDELKKAVTNVALPAVLFISFINMELKKEYFLVMVITFVLMMVFLFVGIMLNRVPALANPLNPFMVSACTFGLLGIPLYGTVFGVENLGKFSVFGVGHEFFVWFVYITYLEIKLSNKKFSVEMMKGFMKSPLIIMIALGIILNVTGLAILVQENFILKGIYTTIQYIANLATPTILIIVGYGLKINHSYMRQGFKFLIIRYSVVLIIGYTFKWLLIDKLIVSDNLFDYAYFTFLILPQPLSLSVFVGKYGTEEQQDVVNNAAVLSTLFCIIVFLLFIMMI
jgi:predicted permease